MTVTGGSAGKIVRKELAVHVPLPWLHRPPRKEFSQPLSTQGTLHFDVDLLDCSSVSCCTWTGRRGPHSGVRSLSLWFVVVSCLRGLTNLDLVGLL